MPKGVYVRQRIPLSVRLSRRLKRMPNGCLEWTGHTSKKGYGRIMVDSHFIGTHRVAWTLANGPIPDGLHVLHHCDNPPCCETEPTPGYPDGHLFLGTGGDNMADMYAKKRDHAQQITHCPQGHPYDEVNTYVNPNTGHRLCRTCNRERAAAAYRPSVPDGQPTVAEDLAFTAWVESQDHELPCGCMASQPRHTCEDPEPDDDGAP